MELENVLRWSKSRAATFYECKRKYYLRYYQHWGGWEAAAPEVSRLAYRLGKMQTMATLLGTAVHEVIAHHLKLLRAGRFQELNPERPVEKMREAWRNAKKELWRGNPKKFPPLFEIYYRRIPPAPELRALAEQARSVIRNLKELKLYQSLLKFPPADYLWIDPAQEKFSEATYFSVPPWEAIASPDLVFQQDGKITIADWKTGKPTDDDRLQVGAAGLWARQRLSPEGRSLKACLVYLSGPTLDEFDLDTSILSQAEAAIHRDIEAMLKYLKDPAQNIPLDADQFPRHNNKKFY